MSVDTRILFTDLDGTLLNDHKEVTSGNQAAIDEALACGHKIVVCTGRPLASARVCAAKAGLDKEGCYVICFNGGQIYDPSSFSSFVSQFLITDRSTVSLRSLKSYVTTTSVSSFICWQSFVRSSAYTVGFM